MTRVNQFIRRHLGNILRHKCSKLRACKNAHSAYVNQKQQNLELIDIVSKCNSHIILAIKSDNTTFFFFISIDSKKNQCGAVKKNPTKIDE